MAEGAISRRSFVEASAAAVASLALVGCSPENKLQEAESQEGQSTIDQELDPAIDGKWVTACCNNNCGGMCVNKVYVVDGVVVRQKTDDVTEDSMSSPQLRACARGRSKKQATFGVDRLKYPMRRKNWEPHTGGKKELRGKDEWVRISWDEALDILADELRNAIDAYGNRSILMANYFAPTYGIAKPLNSIGGTVTCTSSGSMGTAVYHSSVLGLPLMGYGEENDRMDWVNADYIVLYGLNTAWASGPTYSHLFSDAKKAGVKFVYVGPEYNATASHFNAKWIQVRPGTDSAFLFAVAYEMFKADEQDKGSVIDWDFLYKYTVGIDANNMPADAKVDENFYDYVMGKYDGQPKNSEWASRICGTPVEDIKWYADVMKKDNAVTILRSYAAFRTNDSDDTNYLWFAVGCMGGHIGKPGHSVGTAYHNIVGSCIDSIFFPGESGSPVAPPNPVDDIINDPEEWTAVLNGKFNNRAGGTFACAPEDVRDIDIHVIGFCETAGMLSYTNSGDAVESVRKVDFVFSTARDYSPQAQYSDLVLPVITEWEKVGDLRAGVITTLKNREAAICATQVCEPLFEAKSDMEIGRLLAEKLGLDVNTLFPLSEKQEFFNILAGTTMKLPDTGEIGTFLTITQEDIDEWGVDGTPQEGYMTLREFVEKGVCRIERTPGDVYTYYGYQDFIADPEGHPRETPSGKFEIYSQTKADALNAAGYTNGPAWKPYPTYRPALNGYEASFSDFENGVKGDYPYQVFNPHYPRRSHTQFDNLPYLRHAFANPVFISVADAEEKGIVDGDTVRIWNGKYQSLRPASVTARLMPGVVALPHGAWLDMDENGVDHAGAENLFTAPVTSGYGVAGYNTNLINFEKYEGEPLEEDYLLPARMPKIEE